MRGTLPAHPEQGLVYRETATGRRLQPNLDVVIERHALSGAAIHLRTNPSGFRGPDIGAKRVTRLLFLGDSITFADYLPEDMTFVRMIAGLAADDGLDWETINAGVGAIDTRTELSILLEQGLAARPDIVVLGHYLNDFLPSPAILPQDVPAILRPSYFASRAWLAFAARARMKQRHAHLAGAEREFRASLARDYTMRGQPIPPVKVEALNWFSDWGGAWSPAAWEITRRDLELFAGLARQHGFAPRVVSFPSASQVHIDPTDDAPQRNLMEICSELGIPALDLLPVLRTNAIPGKPLFYDQCHHTPEGSRVVARAIYAFLKELD